MRELSLKEMKTVAGGQDKGDGDKKKEMDKQKQRMNQEITNKGGGGKGNGGKDNGGKGGGFIGPLEAEPKGKPFQSEKGRIPTDFERKQEEERKKDAQDTSGNFGVDVQGGIPVLTFDKKF